MHDHCFSTFGLLLDVPPKMIYSQPKLFAVLTFLILKTSIIENNKKKNALSSLKQPNSLKPNTA